MADLNEHSKTNYHMISSQRANDFIKNYENGDQTAVNVLLSNQKREIIEHNRKRLIPIIKTILFCARNNLPLRGHGESGSLKFDNVREDCLSGNQGIFRALLSFRMESGDGDLKSHFDISTKNCTMISSTIQNEIIESMGSVIKQKIVNRVKLSKYFSILCDETTDISTNEQMTICVRYVDLKNCVIREDFLCFVKMVSTTGSEITKTLKHELEKVGLSFDNLRGQGYDGGSNMSGKYNGVQALILNEYPLAFYTHCFSHSLNLCLSKACEVSAIKNMNGIIGTICTFFSSSSKRTEKLKYIIETTLDVNTVKKKKLKQLCQTRWVDRHDAILTFKELYIYIVSTLEDLKHDTNTETSTKATLYGSAITKPDFIIALEVSAKCFSYTFNLSKLLQGKQQDVCNALANVTQVKNALQSIRNDADNSFKEIMETVSKLASIVNIDIKMPRICNRQTKRVNVSSNSPEEYFKVTIYIPFLDSLISQLHSRFDERLKQVLPLQGLIPCNLHLYNDDLILSAASTYENDLPHAISSLSAELHMWRNQWKDTENVPQTAIEAIQHCQDLFPNIKTLLQLFSTLPVTSATPERTFSTLKRIKTYLRSTISQERLNGLALTNINKEENVTVEEIAQDFIKISARRMQLQDWSK